MCDDIESMVTDLRNKGVEIVRPVSDEGWGRVTAIRLPEDFELSISLSHSSIEQAIGFSINT